MPPRTGPRRAAGNTICGYVPELKGDRLALAESTNTAELPGLTRAEDD
ncbi:hypothetical protein ACFXOY_13820 [Streptomyces niveus]